MRADAGDAAFATLVSAAAQLEWRHVPPDLRAHSVRVFADTVGVMMAGGSQAEIVALARGGEDARQACATVLVDGLPRARAEDAAFINGSAGTFLELDEACPPASHPAIHVLPAALATAESLHRSGAELMAAFVAGYEIVARLFDAYVMPYPVHPHGHIGAVGAAVAVAMLQRTDAVEPAHIASSSPVLATWDPCLEGATVRNTWAGLAAEMGIRANRLAAAGFTGSRTAFGTVFGKLVGTLADPQALEGGVDPERLRIAANYFKFHSACAGAHPALDATLALGAMPAADVESVLVELAPQNWKLNRPSAGNELSNRFSIPYAVAAAIVHGHTGPAAFVTDDRVTRLSERVRISLADDLDTPWPPARMPARVTVDLRGRTVTSSVEHPYGHSANPASAERLRAKFERIAPIGDAAGMYAKLLRIESLADVSDLFA